MPYDLSTKVALITGVSRRVGIGAAIARQLAQCGANICTTYYRPYDARMPWGSNSDEAEAIIAELQEMGVRAIGLEADLADPQAPVAIFEQAQAALGHIDILINNATQDDPASIDTLEAALLDQHYAVNIRGMLLLCREFAKRHDGREGGRIISLTSGQGLGPMPESLPYVASKGAIEALTISLSGALSPRNITVNAVDPGATDTGWISPQLRADLLAQAPFKRLGLPDDAARLITFLASPEGRWITGQILRSRGGM